MNVLNVPFIRTTEPEQSFNDPRPLTLPGVLAALMRDSLAGFAALRAHQRHAWHSFLVLLAANALHRAGRATPPEDEETWRALLRALTPDDADDAPWCLIAPPHRPALLQPPLPAGDLAALRNEIATPDGLDMLVTAKNHDLKQARMIAAQPDDWLFALLTLQTMEGFLGAGNYGISRMNGGFANRAGLGIAPPGGPGARVRRDVERLLAQREDFLRTDSPYARTDGLALVWLVPWDGTEPLRPEKLDPWYIEICRRVRLVERCGRITARAGSSKVSRITPIPGGLTGDPWSPVVTEKDGGGKALTVDAGGFHYRRMVDLLFVENVRRADLQIPAVTDAAEGLEIVARALVRGQGKTEGFHERHVPISRRMRQGRREGASDPVAQAATDRVRIAGEMQGKALKPALLALFQNGPAEIDFRDKDANRKADVFLRRFDAAVDATFFDDLRREVEQPDIDAERQERIAWIRQLRTHAARLLREAESAAPHASRRRWRAGVRAADLLHGAARRLFPELTETQADEPV